MVLDKARENSIELYYWGILDYAEYYILLTSKVFRFEEGGVE